MKIEEVARNSGSPTAGGAQLKLLKRGDPLQIADISLQAQINDKSYLIGE